MMRPLPNAVTLSLWLSTTPPLLLASVAVGAVAGRVIGEFAGHRVQQDIHGHSDS
jgi:H+/Cl- antiporter ClcA